VYNQAINLKRNEHDVPREGIIEDPLQKLAVIGVDVAILTLICVSMFSGEPVFKSGNSSVQPSAGVQCEH